MTNPMDEELWITTIDNPFDPFDQFEDWDRFDQDKGYNTCSYLARIATTSHELSDGENRQIVNDAVREIFRMNLTGNYKIVSRRVQRSDS